MMRKWSLERNADINAYEVSDDDRIWCLTLRDEDMAQFIVDALNEKEAREAGVVTVTPSKSGIYAEYHQPGCEGCGRQPCIHSYVSSDMTGDPD